MIRDGLVVPITSGKQRAVLAALLVHANQILTVEDIIGFVWSSPPPTARVTLQNYVKRLRQGLTIPGQPLLITRPSGYLIQAAADELDLTAFARDCAAGHAAAAAADWENASAHWTRALGRWRGTPFADVPSDALATGEGRRLEDTRWHVIEARLGADLRLGRYATVAIDARQLVTSEPLRERLHESLMLALYQNGQRAAALTSYRDARRFLITEVGVEPGRAMQTLHRQILRDDPRLGPPALIRPLAWGTQPI